MRALMLIPVLLTATLGLSACGPTQKTVRSDSPAKDAPTNAAQTAETPVFNGRMVPQIGHTQEIIDILYARNGRFVVTSARDSKVKLWTPDGRLLRTIRSRGSQPRIALSPDDSQLAISGNGGVVDVWSVQGEHIKSLRFKSTMMGPLAYSPGGDYLVVCNRASKRDFCALLNRRFETITLINNPAQGKGSIKAIAIAPDEEHFYLAIYRSVYKFHRSGERLKQFKVTDDFVSAMAMSPDGRRLATTTALTSHRSENKAKANGQLLTRVWDTEGKRLAQFPSHSSRSLHFSADGRSVISGGAHDRHILIHGVDGKLIRRIRTGKYHVSSPAHLALAPDGLRMVTADHNFKPVRLKIRDMDGKVIRNFNRGSAGVINLAVDIDSNAIVTTSTDRQIRIWSLDGRLVKRFSADYDYPSLLALSRDGTLMATGGKQVTLWNGAGKKLVTKQLHKVGGRDAVFMPDGKWLLTGGADGYVNIIPLTKEGRSKRFQPHGGKTVTALAVHPDSRIFATGMAWERFAIWDLDGNQLAAFRMPEGTPPPFSPTFAMQFTPDGRHLVVASARAGSEIRIFDLQGKRVHSLATGNRHQSGSLAVSPDGSLLAASVNNHIGLWNLQTYELLGYLKGHKHSIGAMSFTRDGRHLVSASSDGTVRVWHTRNGQGYAMQSGGDEWIIYTDDGYFDASRNGGDMVSLVDGLDAFGVDQVSVHYNRPDIIYRRAGIGGHEFIDHFKSHYQKRLSRYRQNGNTASALSVPSVTIDSYRQDGKFIDLKFSAGDNQSELGTVQVYVNNVPLYAGTGFAVSGPSHTQAQRVELSAGTNKIEVSATNRQGFESRRAAVYANYRKPVSGDLYFIALGVSRYRDERLNLRYADKDAQDLQALMKRYKGKYKRIHTLVRTNEQATRGALGEIRTFLAGAGVDDTVILSVSGHGSYDLGREATYYFISHETDINDLAGTAIAYRELENLLAGIAPRRKLMLLDTCESGEMDAETLAAIQSAAGENNLSVRTSRELAQRARNRPRTYLYARDRYIYNDLERRNGAIVFSSSLADEVSLESSKLENGVFTEAIMRVLTSTKADSDKDGYISIQELETGVKATVASATLDLQHPNIERENIYQAFKLPVLK